MLGDTFSLSVLGIVDETIAVGVVHLKLSWI